MKVPWAVPFIDERELAEVVETVKSNWLSPGPRVRELERLWAAFVGARHGMAVSNGTVALDLAMKALGIGPEDEVIIPAMTYIATANAALYQGARLTFADIDRVSFCVDPNDIARKITPRTGCIMYIDYGGNPADANAINAIGNAHSIPVVHDAAQSLGGVCQGKPLGFAGTVSTASFHAAKLFTTIEGGMIFTNDDELDKRIRIMRNQGEDPQNKYYHPILGMNGRLTDLQAAIGLVQFSKMKEILQRRNEIAAFYLDALAEVDEITLPMTNICKNVDGLAADCRNGWFLFPILVENRDQVARGLAERGVDTRICYPIPVYRQAYIALLNSQIPTHCPSSEWVTQRILNLPMFHTISESQLKYVVASLKELVMPTSMRRKTSY
jgi:dTDP-4-amino-4,6-dideoxygalactose transaminase